MCKPRAPNIFDFLVDPLTVCQPEKTTPVSSNSMCVPSTLSSSTYCLVSACLGCVRMRWKSEGGEFLEFYLNRKTPLQSGIKSLGLATLKGTCGNKENVVSFNGTVARIHLRAFNHREQITLHAFTRHVPTTDCCQHSQFCLSRQ